MGDDPKRSALNEFNQMHEVRNLFVVDGSCVPDRDREEPDADDPGAVVARDRLPGRGDQARQPVARESNMDGLKVNRRAAIRRLAAAGAGIASAPLWVETLGALAREQAPHAHQAVQAAGTAWTPKVLSATQNDTVADSL